MKAYDFKTIESKWREYWQQNHTYKTVEGGNKPKFYILDMFPYPSGEGLHVGHPKGYIATDVIARKKILEGFNVLHPMGFDSGGLPAENYAIKNKIHPKIAVDKNIVRYKKQLESFGFTYDWDREINTMEPEFYKWTQWIFLKLYGHYYDEKLDKAVPIENLAIPDGLDEKEKQDYVNDHRLAYVDYKPINWCPSCKTGLANEDLEDGKCERCGSDIERKPMRQWVLRITKYAERMLNDLDILPDWEQSIVEMQRNWIGKSQGTQFKMYIDGSDDFFEVYTTRIDTVFGMTFAVIAPEHDLVGKLKSKVKNPAEVDAYIEATKKKTDMQRTELNKEKTGILLEGVFAINPFNGEKVSIFIGDYVLANYGTGAIMAVPAHDERDYEFAKKTGIEIRQSIAPFFGNTAPEAEFRGDKKTVHRNITYSIVFNPKTGKYLILDLLTGEKGQSFIVGGIEDGEDPVSSAIREISEETGYKNVRYIRQVTGEIHARFFAIHKDENRYAIAKTYLFELVDDSKIETSSDEKKRHDVLWLDKNEVDIKFFNQKFAWEIFVNGDGAFTESGILVNSGEFTGLKSDDAIPKMQAWLESKGLGKKKTQYRIQEWVFSRQRYWGEPIPMIHCPHCGVVPLEEKDLPLVLPEVEAYEPTGTEEGPLANISDWINVKCPHCGEMAKRESNTMPQWAGSSWYWLRYMDPRNDEALVGKDKENYWNEVDIYVGGAEHATRHLIYARFWHKFLFDIGAVSTPEPFRKLQHVGLILAEDGRKMSKRWGNVVNPDNIISEFGADSMRIYETFMGPFSQEVAWSTNGVKGVKRFLDKIVVLSEKLSDAPDAKKIEILLNQTIKKVTEDIDDFKFNTAVAQMMTLVNYWTDTGKVNKEFFKKFVQILSPFVPHLAEELWKELGNGESIFKSKWPSYDPAKLVEDTVKIAIQINGKVRDEVEVDFDSSEEIVKEAAFRSENVKRYTDGVEIKKLVYVKNKLLSIVI